MLKPFRKIKLTTVELQHFQDAVANVLVPVSKNPLIDGVLLENVVLTSGDNTISHTLSRQIRGWLIVDKQGAADIYRTGWSDKFLNLHATANVTVNLWVF
jgi:hypothetical protein